MQQFRGPYKEMTARIQTCVQIFDYLHFRLAVEIDQDIAAENKVEIAIPSHLIPVKKIEVLKPDHFLNLGIEVISIPLLRKVSA